LKEFLIEYGSAFFLWGLIPFAIIISIPFYLIECGDLSHLIFQIRKYNKIIEKEQLGALIGRGLLFDVKYMDLDIGFGRLPTISKNPNYFNFKIFREQVATIKQFRKIYQRIIFGYGSVFIILFIIKRAYFAYF
jgi:hypothetical protein